LSTRPCRKRHGPENGPVEGQSVKCYQGQREVEASCKNLIVGEHLTEEEKRRRRKQGIYI